MKKMLNKLFKKQKRKINIEITNYTGIDIDVEIRIVSEDTIEIILVEKDKKEVLQNTSVV